LSFFNSEISCVRVLFEQELLAESKIHLVNEIFSAKERKRVKSRRFDKDAKSVYADSYLEFPSSSDHDIQTANARMHEILAMLQVDV
jgi:hypothetical protein